MTGETSWFQQGPGTSGSSVGKTSAEPLTQAVTQATAGVASGALIAAAAAGVVSREITIFVPATADTGIYYNYGSTAAAAGTSFFMPSGSSRTVNTLQAMTCIRAGAADVTVYVDAGTVQNVAGSMSPPGGITRGQVYATTPGTAGPAEDTETQVGSTSRHISVVFAHGIETLSIFVYAATGVPGSAMIALTPAGTTQSTVAFIVPPNWFWKWTSSGSGSLADYFAVDV